MNSREWYELVESQKMLRAQERDHIEKRLPALRAQLAKAEGDLANMREADRIADEKYGEKSEQGKENKRKLDAWRGFLKMENDEVPQFPEKKI